MIAIGIDPGTINLGWGVVASEGNRLRHVAHGVIRMPAEDALSARLLRIADDLDQVLAQYCPQLGSVRAYFSTKMLNPRPSWGTRAALFFCAWSAARSGCVNIL